MSGEKLLIQYFNAGVAKDIYYSQGVEPEIEFRLRFHEVEGDLQFNFSYDRDKNTNYDVLQSSHSYEFVDFETYSLFNKGFQYLLAERWGPREHYKTSVGNVIKNENLGLHGEHTAFYLESFGLKINIHPILKHPKAKSDKLLYHTDAWLSEISPGVHLQTGLSSNSEYIEIKYEYGIYKYKPKNVGFGLSYVLPVIVALLTAEEGKLIIIENPESHIHPRGQVELGRLIAFTAQTGAQLIIETHSDHILNGIKIAVKEKTHNHNTINPETIKVLFFKRNQEDYSSEVTSIIIDINGKLHKKTAEGTSAELPKGFFDEWTNSMFKLV